MKKDGVENDQNKGLSRSTYSLGRWWMYTGVAPSTSSDFLMWWIHPKVGWSSRFGSLLALTKLFGLISSLPFCFCCTFAFCLSVNLRSSYLESSNSSLSNKYKYSKGLYLKIYLFNALINSNMFNFWDQRFNILWKAINIRSLNVALGPRTYRYTVLIHKFNR